MRPPNILRSVSLHVQIREDIHGKMYLHLFSPLEGRVPHGAYAKLINQLLKDYLDKLKDENVSTITGTN